MVIPTSRSPVERLANQMRSTKALDRPPSSETMSPETTPVNSPVKKPRTPTKAAPPPPNQASKNKPEPYDFVIDEGVFQRPLICVVVLLTWKVITFIHWITIRNHFKTKDLRYYRTTLTMRRKKNILNRIFDFENFKNNIKIHVMY